MKHLSLILVLAVAWSCNNEPKQPPPAATSDNASKPVQTPVVSGSLAVIIGDGVRIRQEASVNSAILTKVSTGERVQILGTSTGKDSTSLDACEVYPMIQVKTASGLSGWIFGKFVYRILDDGFSADINPVAFDNRMLQLKRCRNFGIGASDGEGLTGCDEYYPVLLTDTKTGEFFLVPISNLENNVPNFKFWNLEDDEGGKETVKSLKSDAQKITASVFAGYMEGCARYDVHIAKGLKGYQGSCVNYQKLPEKQCE